MTEVGDTGAAAAAPVIVMRGGRGAKGGSFALNHVIQRARFGGRKVRPLDADKRSQTLIGLYGPPATTDRKAAPNPEWATAPISEEPVDVKNWLLGELDQMAADGMSRCVDFNGGDRIMSEVQRDLNLGPFCEAVGIQMLSLITLGPEIEDFRHMVMAARAGHLQPNQVLLVLNEGVIGQGQTTAGAFDAIMAHDDFRALLKDGARAILMRRLPCVPKLRETGLGLYEAAYPTPGRPNPSATLQHMTRQWLENTEAKLEAESVAGRLP